MNPAVGGYVAAVLDEVPPADRATVASDLSAVERLMDTNGPLRVALSDTAVPPQTRRAVLVELLEHRVSAPASRIAGYVVASVHAQEVPSALAWVASRAHLTAEGESEGEALGHSDTRLRLGGYATAVFEEVGVPDLDEIEDELFRFTRTVEAAPALREALGDRDLPTEVRVGVVDDLLAGKVQPATLRLVRATVTAGRVRDIVGALDWLVEQTALARGWRVAHVRAGQAVDDEERRKLQDTLSRMVGSPVELEVTVDPQLLAGVTVEIGDLQLDATARGRLDRLREHVYAGGWEDQGFGRAGRADQGPGQDARQDAHRDVETDGR